MTLLSQQVTTPLDMPVPADYSVRLAHTAADIQSFAKLALEYQQWLGVDLCFQAFEKELSSLPGCYSPPAGCILLLSHQISNQQQPAVDVGCVAVRPLHTNHALTAHATAHTTAHATAHTTAANSQQTGWSPHATCQQQQQQHQALAAAEAGQQVAAPAVLHSASNALQQQPVTAAAAAAAATAAAQPDLSSTCEMKRLWVTQGHQGKGSGKALAVAAITAARQAGYRHMVLDTLQTLTAANKLYSELGFVQRDAYCLNPLPGVVYWQLEL